MNAAASLWAAFAVLGFAMVFAVPPRSLPVIMGLAVGAHLLRSVCLHWGAALPVASFVAAVAIGCSATVLAPRSHRALAIYAFAPVIPLIPGTYMFDALLGLIGLTTTDPPSKAIVDEVVINISIATLTIIALAVGAIGPTLMVGRRIAALVVRDEDGDLQT